MQQDKFTRTEGLVLGLATLFTAYFMVVSTIKYTDESPLWGAGLAISLLVYLIFILVLLRCPKEWK